MPRDLLEELARMEVPAAPGDLPGNVHRRLNGRLVVVQLIEFVVNTTPFALIGILTAFGALIHFTLLGEHVETSHRQDN